MSEEHAAVLTKPGSRVTMPVVDSTFVTSIPSDPSVACLTGRSSSALSLECRATLLLATDASGIRGPFHVLLRDAYMDERPGSPATAPPRWGPEVYTQTLVSCMLR